VKAERDELYDEADQASKAYEVVLRAMAFAQG